MMMFGIGLSEVVILTIIGLAVVLPSWRIFTKAGFSGWLALLMLVPLVNIAVEYYVAFTDWPLSKEVRELRRLTSEHRGN
jgi:uncharacterized membrane protein YhaH (DUF805 family)